MYFKKLFLVTILCLFSSLAWSKCISGNCYDGQGAYTWPDGNKYVGEYRDGKRHGQGTYIWLNQEIYVGAWQDNKQHGHGTITLANGEKYVGEHRDGKRQGQGTNTFANGDKYIGAWLYNVRHGLGIYLFANGEKYVGEYRDGQPHGQGTYTWANGDKYIGAWRYNLQHGLGIYLFANGKVEEGMYINGEYSYYVAYEPDENIVTPKTIREEGLPDDGKMLQASSGTGFAVSYDGHIITNHHVIDACQEIKVRYKSDDILAKLIAFDTVNDLAILKIDTKPSSVLPISYSNPEILQEIYVAGFPFGENVSTSIKMTKGIVSSLTGMGNNYSNIQIDAALQPGNSGGPVFDDKGNVVGVAVAKIDLEYAIEKFGVVPENTNFGIKSSVVINFLESNSIGNLASPLNYKASMTSLGKSVTDATYYVSCMMTMAQIRKVQARKVIYSELIK